VRWLNRVWSLVLETVDTQPQQASQDVARNLERKVHQTIRQVSHDLKHFEFNTVISALMELTNEVIAAKDAGLAGSEVFKDAVEYLLLLMAPGMPHIAEELWSRIGKPYSIHQQPWPVFDPEIAKEEEITLVLQVNGKVRDRVLVPADISEEDARRIALESENIQRFLSGKEPRQVIVVRGRLVNVVV